MSHIDVPLVRSGFGETRRPDTWWVQPLVVFLGLSTFIVYSTWAALQGSHFRFGLYLSPFYSPELFGTLVLLINVVLLSCYTFGCHSLRHLVGGFRDRLAGAPVRKGAYDCVSCLNRRHMLFAWCSLFSVGFSDLYIRMCSMGIWHDWRIV